MSGYVSEMTNIHKHLLWDTNHDLSSYGTYDDFKWPLKIISAPGNYSKTNNIHNTDCITSEVNYNDR